VIVCTRPPAGKDGEARASTLDDETLFGWLKTLGGMPGEPEVQRDLFELFKDALRADLEAYERYQPTAVARSPFLCIAGLGDPICPYRSFLAWNAHARAPRLEYLPGAHVAMQTRPREVARLISAFVHSSSLEASA
jgi:surfactin synthase thioesterase subunit